MRIIFMGVSGCGKTTLASRLAEHLQCGPVLEADTLHAPEMREKMRAGIPLTDEDRWPWLDRINAALRACTTEWTIATCSALRRVYRERLAHGLEDSLHFIFLEAPQETILERVKKRTHDYMPVSLLESQFATLERPQSDEPVTIISVAGNEDSTFSAIYEVIERLMTRA